MGRGAAASTPRAAGKHSRHGLIGAVLLVVVGLTGIGLANLSLSRDSELGGGPITLGSTGREGAEGGEGDAVRRSELSGEGLTDGGEGAVAEEGPSWEGGDYGRAMAVRAAMLHAWRSYERFAMGAAELHPVAKTAKHDIMGGSGISGMGVTVVDAMSTLHLMGLHDDFSRARDWLYGSLHFDRSVEVSFFETVIRLLGGLVACYDLSGDKMFLDKATVLADRLLVNFRKGGSGMPGYAANLGPYGFTPQTEGQVSLATVGSNILEFGALSLRTGRSKYMVKAERGIRRLHRCNTHQALLAKNLELATGEPRGEEFGVGAEADSYFEYLLKYWILTGKQDNHWKRRWVAAADEIMERLVPNIESDPTLMFTGELHGATLTNELEHLACFWPGNVALGVMHGAVSGAKAELYLRFAEGMTRACYQLYNSTATGLGAERVVFDLKTGNATATHGTYWQRPEVIESIFYLWRATKDPKYREWGWRMFEAFEKYCKQEAGYSGVQDVMQDPPVPDDAQQSWLLAETLKYWYLLFAPDSAFSLEDWVLNTEAHPLRVWKPEHPAPPADDKDEEVPDLEDPCGYYPQKASGGEAAEEDGQSDDDEETSTEGQAGPTERGQQADAEEGSQAAAEGQAQVQPQEAQEQANQAAIQQAEDAAKQQQAAQAAGQEGQQQGGQGQAGQQTTAQQQATAQEQTAAEQQAAVEQAAAEQRAAEQRAAGAQAAQQNAAAEAQAAQQKAVAEAQATQQKAAAEAQATQQKAAAAAQAKQQKAAAAAQAKQQKAAAEAQAKAQAQAAVQQQAQAGPAKQDQAGAGDKAPVKKEAPKAKEGPKQGGDAQQRKRPKGKDAVQPQPKPANAGGAAQQQQVQAGAAAQPGGNEQQQQQKEKAGAAAQQQPQPTVVAQ